MRPIFISEYPTDAVCEPEEPMTVAQISQRAIDNVLADVQIPYPDPAVHWWGSQIFKMRARRIHRDDEL